MATKQLSLPGTLVKKANKLIRAKIDVGSPASNSEGSRILASLIACIRTTDKDFKEFYQLPVKDLLSNLSGSNYTRVKNICRDLAKTTAEVEEIGEDGEAQFTIYTFFSRLEYGKGIISARFNAEMRPMLIQLQEFFTEYNLLDYLRLPSIYSQRIFEILKSWDDKPEVTISVEELHRMLDTPESLRKDFRNFRLRVLEKAHKDITSKTSLYYEWESIKQGRAVVAVRFIFARKRALPVAEEKEKNELQKQSRKNTAIFKAAVACFKEHGPGCTGGHQKTEICEACKRLASKEKSS